MKTALKALAILSTLVLMSCADDNSGFVINSEEEGGFQAVPFGGNGNSGGSGCDLGTMCVETFNAPNGNDACFDDAKVASCSKSDILGTCTTSSGSFKQVTYFYNSSGFAASDIQNVCVQGGGVFH